MRQQMKALIGIVMTVLCLALKTKAQSFTKYEANVQGITFRIDPRIELFNAVAMLFGHNGMTQSNIPYKQEMLEHFLPYKDHPAVDSLYNSYLCGWGIDDPIFYMLCLDSNFQIMEGLSDGQIDRGGGIERLKLLASLFGDFVKKSNFYKWFNISQHNFYQQVIAQTQYNFRNFTVIPLFEKYYGERMNKYIAVINLMGAYGNFGRAFTRNGKTDLYAVVETNASAGEVPVFSPSVPLFHLIVHEFSHGFVNPALGPHIASIDKDSALYTPIKFAMQASGYYTWRSTVYETVVPAVVIRIAEQYYGKDFAYQNFYRVDMGRRFIYMDTLLNELKFYENHRDQFPRFKDFAPRLLSVFGHISQEYIAMLQQKVADMRKPDVNAIPKPTAFAHDSTTYFIIGTYEPDAKAQLQMENWAKIYHKMISPNSPIITDKEALTMNLAGHDIVLFGTPDGNALTGRYIHQLPLKILNDRILTNKTVKGNHLQLITSWISPFDINKAMIIYTAQQTWDIYNFQTSPYKEQYGYWVGENTITLDKGEWNRGALVWKCDLF